MNRADRRRAVRASRDLSRFRRDHGDPSWRCPLCSAQAGTVVEICIERCCDPQQRCASCGCPVA